jgi:hypothetical protein
MDTLVTVLVPAAIACGVFIYPALQYFAVRRMVGRWRLWAVLPLGPMVFVLALTVYAFLKESNVWPIPLIFVGPLAAIYLSFLFGARALLIRQRQERE